MLRFFLLLTLVLTTIGAPNEILEIQIVDDISKVDFPIDKIDNLDITFNVKDEQNYVRHYTLGSRRSGDRLVAQGHGSRQWPSPQDVQVTLRYPSRGSGNLVTFVDLVITQTSNVGKAYIVSGGIGQRFIAIVAEAQHTTLLGFQISIYGV